MTITLDNGTKIEATDHDDAMKQIRKAKREEKKTRAAEQAKTDRAYEIAQVNGFKIYSRAHCDEVSPFKMIPSGHRYIPAEIPDDDRLNIVVDTVNGKFTYRMQTAYFQFIGIIWDRAGWHIGLAIKDLHTGENNVFSVGVCDGQWAFEQLHGISPSDFEIEE